MASKKTVNMQLQIDTTFKNAKAAVESLNKTLSGINLDKTISDSGGIKTLDAAKTKVQELQAIMDKIKGSEYTGVNDKYFNDLFKSLNTKAEELKTLQASLSSIKISNQLVDPSADLNDAQADLAAQKTDLELINQLLVEAQNNLAKVNYDPSKAGYQEAVQDVTDLTNEQTRLANEIAISEQAVATLSADFQDYQQAGAAATQAQQQFSDAQNKINTTLDEANRLQTAGLDSMSGIKKATAEQTKEEKERVTALKELSKALDEAAETDQRKAEAEKQATEASKKRISALEQDTTKTLIEYQNAANQSVKSTNDLSTALESSIIKWGSFTAIVHTAISAVKDIISTYQELDDNLSAISAVSGIATESLWGDMPQMIDNANKLALSIDDLTNGMLLFYQQGLSTEETEIRLNAAGKMAAISQQDLSTAVDQLTSTMNAFGMEGEDAANVVDVFASMAGKTAVNVEELATAMARTASIAKNAGMSFEQTTAFIATMEETTRLSAETIGNSMKSIIARFQKLKTDPDSLLEDGVNANDVEKALKKADVALRDTEGNFRNIGDVIMELSAKWDTLDTNTQKYIATMAAGTQQSSNFIALVGNYSSNVDNLAYAMDSAGAAEEQFQAVGNNLSAALQRLDNNFTALKTSFLEDTGALTTFVNILAGFIDILAKIPGPIKTITITTAAWTLMMAKHNLQVQKKIASARQELAIEIQSYAQKIENASGNQAEINAIIENVEAHARLTAAVKGLNEAETDALVTKAKSIIINAQQKQSIDEITKELNKGSTSLMNYSVEGKTVTSVFASMGESIGGVAGSLVKAIPYVGAVIGVLSVVNAILKSVFGIDIVGSIENWIKNGIEKFRDSIDHSLEHTTKKLENFKEEIKSLKDESKELNSTLTTIDEYSTKLQEAHDNSESLDDIRQEILDNIDSEKLGIDVLTASYEDLTDALEKYYKIQQEEADKKTAEYIDKQVESNKTTQDFYKNQTNTYISAGEDDKAYVKKNGEQISKSELQEEYAENKRNDEDVDSYAKRMGYTIFTSPKYGIQTIDGQWNYYDTAEEAREALEQLEADAAKIILNQDEADALARDALTNSANSSVAELDPTALSLSIQSYYKNIGSAFESGTNIFTQDFLDFQDSATKLATNAGVTLQDTLNYINGDFSQLSTDTIQKIQNASSSENEALQQAIDSQTQAYQDSINQLRTSLSEQNVILDEDTAEKIGLGPLKEIQKVVESTGPRVANELIKLYDGNFNSILNGIEIDPDALDGVKEQLENAIGDLTDDLNLSDLSETFSELLNSYLDGDIDSTQFLMALQAISSSSTDAAENLSGLVSTMQQVTAASQDSFTSMESVSQTWSTFGTNLGYIQQLASDTGISLDQLKSVAEALGMTVDEMIASGNLTQIGEQFFANSEDAEVWANSLMGLTDSQLAQAQAEQEAVSANAEAAAAQARNSAAILNAEADKIESYADDQSAMNSLIPANSELMKSAIDVAKAQKELNIQMAAETPAVNDLTSSAKTTSVTYGELAAKIRTYASELEASANKEDAAKDAADAKANYISNLRTQLQSAKKDWQNYGKSASSGSTGGSGSSSAADNVNEATEALEKQKEALQEAQKELEEYKQQLEDTKKALEDQKSALEEVNKTLQENYKLYLDLIKTRLNDEIDRQTTRIEAFYDAIQNVVQEEIDSLNDQLDALKKQADKLKEEADKLQDAADDQKDSLDKLYDAAQAYYDAAQDGLDNEIDSYDKVIDRNKERIDLLDEQKDAIQAQIDALDTASDSESKLLALEKARDALANARNSKTRMVLTNGGGWRLRTDKAEISNAQSNLASAQRDYQKTILERQQKEIEDQTDEIEKQNDNLENIKDTLENQKDAIDDIKDQWDKAQDALGKTTSELEEQTNLIRQLQYGDNNSRADQLNQFVNGVNQNNQAQQAASDASNKADEASNAYDQQSNEDVAGSIAEAIKKLEEQQNQADEALKQYFENQLSNNAETAEIQKQMKDLIDQMVSGQIGQLENFQQFYETINGALEQANTNASQTADYINRINASLDQYDEWSNRLDMTTDEINQRQAIMNEINNATLGSLIEGGSTFGQLQSQYEQIVRNNDEAEHIQGQIDGLDSQINTVQEQIDALKEQENAISEQEKELSNSNSNKVSNATKSAGTGIQQSVSNAASELSQAIAEKEVKVEVHGTGNSSQTKVGNKQVSAIMNVGGTLGFSHGGVDDVTRTVAVHGTKNRPELILNNSQSAALFKYIDSMTRIPTLSTAGSARNALSAFGTSNNTNNNGTNFTNCEFNVESNADNLDSLIQDLKQSASIRR